MSKHNLSPEQEAELVGCPSCDKLVHTALLVSHSYECAARRDAKIAAAVTALNDDLDDLGYDAVYK